MKTRRITRISALLLAGGWLTLSSSAARAADFYLAAAAFDAPLPNPANPADPLVRMWGFAECDATFATCGAPSSPGPTLRVDPLEPAPVQLNIHVRNDLAVPVSLVMPAQLAALVPNKVDDGTGRLRAKSLAAETAPGAVGVYSWSVLRSGTYLYHSGTQPQVQVQMGLLGALIYDVAPNTAYENVPYDDDLLLVFSEVDPALHAAVRDGTYGTDTYPSTVDYRPKYFLINGAPFVAGQAALPAGAANGRTLIRFVNGGLQHRVPQLVGSYLDWIAENGNAAPYARRLYGEFLAAGSTRDALFMPSAAGTFGLYDRMLGLTSNQVTGGGFYAQLAVAAGGAGLTAAGTRTRASNGQLLDVTAGGLHTTSASLAQFPRLQAKLKSKPLAPVAAAPAPVVVQPLAADRTVTTRQGQPVKIELFDATRDRSIDPASVAIVVRPRFGGKLTNSHDGTVVYTPGVGYIPSDSFDFTVNDALGNVLEPVTVIVNIEPGR